MKVKKNTKVRKMKIIVKYNMFPVWITEQKFDELVEEYYKKTHTGRIFFKDKKN